MKFKIRGEITKVTDIFYNISTQDINTQRGIKIKQWDNCYPLEHHFLNQLEDAYQLAIPLYLLLDEIKHNNIGDTKPKKIYDSRLYDYQNKSVANMMLMKNIGVFNQQRTGKTPTVLVALREKKFKKTIITMKASLLYQWKEEIETWLGYEAILINHSPKKRHELYEKFQKSEGTEILLISYDTLKLDWEKFQKDFYDCLVVDEADFLRNVGTKRTKCLFKVRKRCKFCWLLTGTPAVNDRHDIIPLVSFMNGVVSSWNLSDFFFWRQKISMGRGRVKTYYQFNQGLETILQNWLQLFTLNTKRKEVWNLIPAVKRTIIHIPMEGKQLEHYNNLLHYFVSGEREKVFYAENTLITILRLRQLMLDPRIIDGLGFKGKSSKTKQIIQYVKDFHKTKKIIIFADFTKYLNLLKEEFDNIKIESGLFTGQINQKDRHKTVSSFQKGKLNVILVNTEAGAKGLTLSSGDVIIFAQNNYSYVLREQAEDRFIAQDDKPREIIDFISTFTGNSDLNVEESILQAQKRKQNETSIINNWKEMLNKIVEENNNE